MIKRIKYFHIICYFSLNSAILYFLSGCSGTHTKTEDVITLEETEKETAPDSIADSVIQIKPFITTVQRQRIKLGHAINTASNEYLPVLNSDGTRLYFSAMDRTGFFDFKLDFTKQQSAGGEDIFYSDFREGIFSDARPMNEINTNCHEVVTQIFNNGDLLVTGNYPENFGVRDKKDAGVQTTDLFYLRKGKSGYQINHFPEPVNSIFTESDGYMTEEQTFILFVSDRNGNIGEYQKKGWKWNESFWGNTDVYVSMKEGGYWSVPVNLGPKVNTPFAERTPWLSEDGLTLFLSSNGYIKGKTDLDVYAFKRKNRNEWHEWDGPYAVKDANTMYDDWGYKQNTDGDGFVASSDKLGYKPTQGGTAGDGGFRETNYRSGYDVHGLQIAALNREYETNIYQLKNLNKPTFTLSEVFFDFNSYTIKKTFEKYLLLLTDQIGQNKQATIEISGHTDNTGNKGYNQKLSQKRAEAIKIFLISKGISNSISTMGYGDTQPAFPNTTTENRNRNRRVDIYLRTGKVK